MEKIKEIWKDIPGYKGKYQASSQGRIKSLERKVQSINWYTKMPFLRTVPERILKPGRFCKSGHLSVVLCKGSSGSPVHQLIMKTFAGEPPDNMEVLHRNGNPTDNRLCNLRYGSRTDNILDVYRQGKRWRKLDIEDVQEIRFALSCGYSGVELSKMYGVSETIISGIKCGRIFTWLK